MTDAIKLAIEALEEVSAKLRLTGAKLPAPEPKGTIESAMTTGICMALAVVEGSIAALRAQPDTGLQTAIRLVLDATPEQLPMAIDALRDFAQPDHSELVNDAARYAHVLECDYLATKTYLPDTTREKQYSKLREKHDAGRKAIGETK